MWPYLGPFDTSRRLRTQALQDQEAAGTLRIRQEAKTELRSVVERKTQFWATVCQPCLVFWWGAFPPSWERQQTKQSHLGGWDTAGGCVGTPSTQSQGHCLVRVKCQWCCGTFLLRDSKWFHHHCGSTRLRGSAGEVLATAARRSGTEQPPKPSCMVPAGWGPGSHFQTRSPVAGWPLWGPSLEQEDPDPVAGPLAGSYPHGFLPVGVPEGRGVQKEGQEPDWAQDHDCRGRPRDHFRHVRPSDPPGGSSGRDLHPPEGRACRKHHVESVRCDMRQWCMSTTKLECQSNAEQ